MPEPNVITVVDQTATTKPPKVEVTVAVDAIPRYVVVAGEDGQVLGDERVFQKAAKLYKVGVELPRSFTPTPLTAQLFEASGNAPDMAKPVLNLAGDPIVERFEVVYPPNNSLQVTDQTPLSSGNQLKIKNITVEELPAWVAVYSDVDGAPGTLVGKLLIESSPKVLLSLKLNRYVKPTETLWVAMHLDLPADGMLTADDPSMLDPHKQPLLVSITATNTSCDGIKTKVCDPENPGQIGWLDVCDAATDVIADCGEGGLSDQSAGYVGCKTSPDTCAGNTTKVFWLDYCGVLNGSSFSCSGDAVCDDTGGRGPLRRARRPLRWQRHKGLRSRQRRRGGVARLLRAAHRRVVFVWQRSWV